MSSKSSSVVNEVAGGIEKRAERKAKEVKPLYSPMNIEPCQITKEYIMKTITPRPPPHECNHYTGLGLLAYRANLTPAERLHVLAAPRKRPPPLPIPPNTPRIITVTRTIPPNSVSISNLAKPLARRVFHTWHDHDEHLPSDKKRNLQRYLRKDTITTIANAEMIIREHRKYQRHMKLRRQQEKRRNILSRIRETKRITEMILEDVIDEVSIVASVSHKIEHKLNEVIQNCGKQVITLDNVRGELTYNIAKDITDMFKEKNEE